MGKQAIIVLAFATGILVGAQGMRMYLHADASALRSDLIDTQAANQELQIELDRQTEFVQQLLSER